MFLNRLNLNLIKIKVEFSSWNFEFNGKFRSLKQSKQTDWLQIFFCFWTSFQSLTWRDFVESSSDIKFLCWLKAHEKRFKGIVDHDEG